MTDIMEDKVTVKEDAEASITEDEDDYTGYFLEPTANSASIVERIAEANRKLYEEDESRVEDGDRPKKVQFSESLVNIEPENYESDEFIESDENSSSEGEVDNAKTLNEDAPDADKEKALKRSLRPKTANKDPKPRNPEVKLEIPEEIAEEIMTEEVAKEDVEEESQQTKVLLVMLPREQSSSCESVIGEEILEEKVETLLPEKVQKKEAEITPKSEVIKPVKANRVPSPCKVSKISPDLNFSPKEDGKKWERKPALKCKKQKKEEKEETGRPKSAVETKTEVQTVSDRPKTSSEKRSCCIVRTGLPKYNGLRSEYGLSAEQLQERRRKTFELRQQKRMDRMNKRQEEIRRRIQNEENFSQWLMSKRRGATMKRPVQVDTLSRSDVYIQNHAVYASRRGISYSVEYGLGRKKYPKSGRILLFDRKHEKFINLDRLFDNVTPHVKRIYRIYLGEGGCK